LDPTEEEAEAEEEEETESDGLAEAMGADLPCGFKP
jgi:hypothetical protein